MSGNDNSGSLCASMESPVRKTESRKPAVSAPARTTELGAMVVVVDGDKVEGAVVVVVVVVVLAVDDEDEDDDAELDEEPLLGKWEDRT